MTMKIFNTILLSSTLAFAVVPMQSGVASSDAQEHVLLNDGGRITHDAFLHMIDAQDNMRMEKVLNSIASAEDFYSLLSASDENGTALMHIAQVGHLIEAGDSSSFLHSVVQNIQMFSAVFKSSEDLLKILCQENSANQTALQFAQEGGFEQGLSALNNMYRNALNSMIKDLYKDGISSEAENNIVHVVSTVLENKAATANELSYACHALRRFFNPDAYVETPTTAPNTEAPVVDTPSVDLPVVEVPSVNVPVVDEPVDTPALDYTAQMHHILNQENNNGDTLLSIAATRGDSNTLARLLGGANVYPLITHTNHDGNNAVMLAEMNGHPEVVNQLLDLIKN